MMKPKSEGIHRTVKLNRFSGNSELQHHKEQRQINYDLWQKAEKRIAELEAELERVRVNSSGCWRQSAEYVGMQQRIKQLEEQVKKLRKIKHPVCIRCQKRIMLEIGKSS